MIVQVHYVLDATRQQDGLRVAIKVVTNDSDEVSIASSFSAPNLVNDRQNHCVRVVDVFPDPLDVNHRSLLVMQYLRPFDDPDFSVMGEALDFIRQALEVSIHTDHTFTLTDTPHVCRVSPISTARA